MILHSLEKKDDSVAREFALQLFGELHVIPCVWLGEPFDCFETSKKYGEVIIGHYLHKDNNDLLHAERHCVSLTKEGLMDFSRSPTLSNETYFILSDEKEERLMYDGSVVSYKYKKQHESDMYYVYSLIDPRDETPFYVGKGCGKRAWYHLSERAAQTSENPFKQNKIDAIRASGREPYVDIMVADIIDEDTAYELEAFFIKKYGRKVDGGILTNICEDSRPPKLKGRTYREIFGPEEGERQRLRRSQIQKEAGGWFRGHKHNEQSKMLMSARSHAHHLKKYGKSKEEWLEIGRQFCKTFDFCVSANKWYWFAQQHNLPRNLRPMGLGESLLDLWIRELGAVKDVRCRKLLWFHNPQTLKTFRCLQWEYERGIKIPPVGFERGRGTAHKKKQF